MTLMRSNGVNTSLTDFGMYRFDWRDAVDEPGRINLPISGWFHQLTDNGIVVADSIDARHAGSEMRDFVMADWADQWPAEMGMGRSQAFLDDGPECAKSRRAQRAPA